MLFEIKPNLQQSAVFDGLNRFLRETMLATLEDRPVDGRHLPVGLCAAIAGNQPTCTAVDALTAKLSELDQGAKQTLMDVLALDIAPSAFLSDRTTPLPVIPEAILPQLKTLAIHLFQRTAKLKDVEQACGECIDDHYARFRHGTAPGNGNVCCVCGTEYLAQIKADANDNEQWRGPYDHLLAKDLYPLYGVDPKNLLPICTTCNSKAKLAKDLLFKDEVRRLSFSPWTERASLNEIEVVIDDAQELFPRVVVNFKCDDPDRQEKLITWDDVYKIKSRVEGEFRELGAKVAEDARAPDDASFLVKLRESGIAKVQAQRLTPFNYWRARVYAAVSGMNPRSREALRQATAPTPQEIQAMEVLFFQ
ncbi:hypothetical protein J2732_002935 [Achromobacter deleyi]|uniref:hypothetical protein n=1 Tax=Achromobacter deleyi TaxID=1353891 RepID=UPI00285F43E6|nr:hypothetical protein [Achromobacter deleyi]MDR6601943.1 hypothetical protein [Achromobacter deleyi]